MSRSRIIATHADSTALTSTGSFSHNQVRSPSRTLSKSGIVIDRRGPRGVCVATSVLLHRDRLTDNRHHPVTALPATSPCALPNLPTGDDSLVRQSPTTKAPIATTAEEQNKHNDYQNGRHSILQLLRETCLPHLVTA